MSNFYRFTPTNGRKKDASSLEVSFTTVIEQLKSEKLKLSAELRESVDQTTKIAQMKELAEEEATRLKSIIQAVERDKQILQQQVQNLTDLVEYFKNTIRQSVDDFMNHFRLNLDLLAAG